MSRTFAESESQLAASRVEAACVAGGKVDGRTWCQLKADLMNAEATVAELRSALNSAQCMVSILTDQIERERGK